MQLRVASPGYKSLRRAHIESVEGGIAGVQWLGSLPQSEIHAEVRAALCVFYLNFVLPETFGLVLAEAKALGTPVLTHACGAAVEVLGDGGIALPVPASARLYEKAASSVPTSLRRFVAPLGERLGLFEPYVEQVRAWRNGARPVTGPDARFRLSRVTARWRALLAGTLQGA
jgi:glycosyltransferase involved in cell wall biosynthesis